MSKQSTITTINELLKDTAFKYGDTVYYVDNGMETVILPGDMPWQERLELIRLFDLLNSYGSRYYVTVPRTTIMQVTGVDIDFSFDSEPEKKVIIKCKTWGTTLSPNSNRLFKHLSLAEKKRKEMTDNNTLSFYEKYKEPNHAD